MYKNGVVGSYMVVCNSRGDVDTLYNVSGNVVAKYTYDSWGNTISVTDANGKAITSPNHIGNINPIRYRGYYYDTETGLYYLQSRYYNPTVGRFLNADIYCDTQSSILGTNMFAYCGNNPVMFVDYNGFDFTWATLFDIVSICLIIDNLFPEYRIDIIGSTSLLPTGKPNTTETLYKDGVLKQKRWYGGDGKAIWDRDYSHPGDMPFPHYHSWENGERSKKHLPPSPEYEISWEPLIGVILLAVCIIGIIIIALNDVTGVGVLDDFLIAPLTFGIERGSSLIFA